MKKTESKKFEDVSDFDDIPGEGLPKEEEGEEGEGGEGEEDMSIDSSDEEQIQEGESKNNFKKIKHLA